MTLSVRQHQILEGMSRDRTHGQIARELFISVDTVKNHVQKLYRALGVHGQGGAVGEGYRRGLLQVNPDASVD